MLVLSRNINQSIRLDSDVVVKVLAVGDGQVKIGVVSSSKIPLFRSELNQRVKAATVDS